MFRPRSLAAFLFASTLTFAQVTFSNTAYNSGDSSSASVALGDFNHDGILDAVTVNTASLSFYRGLGGGKFAAPVRQSLPSGFGQVVAADLNRDGLLDLVIAPAGSSSNSLKEILVMFGNGNGTFRMGHAIPINSAYARIALADFNGDHIPDLAYSDCTQVSNPVCQAQVMLGHGDGTFSVSATLPMGGGDIAAGDFDGDGRQDVAVLHGPAYNNNYVELYRGNGNGTFQSPLAAFVPYAVAITSGDFFGTRVASLAVLTNHINASGSDSDDTFIYTLRYSNGSLIAVAHQQLQYGTAVPYEAIAAGDLNGDLKDDLVLVGGNAWGDFDSYMLGNGNGTFGAQQRLPNYGGAYFATVRDINGDSRHDVVTNWNQVLGGPGGLNVDVNTNAAVNCSLPPANVSVVHICAPRNSQVVGSSFVFSASGSAWNNGVKRMELWIDGHKVGQYLSDQFRQTVPLARGSHTATFVAVDVFDRYVKGSVSFTASY